MIQTELDNSIDDEKYFELSSEVRRAEIWHSIYENALMSLNEKLENKSLTTFEKEALETVAKHVGLRIKVEEDIIADVKEKIDLHLHREPEERIDE